MPWKALQTCMPAHSKAKHCKAAVVAEGCCAAHLKLLQHSLEVAASPLQPLHLDDCFKKLLIKPSDLQIAKKSVSTAGQAPSPA